VTSTLGETWSRRDHHARGKNTRRVLRPLAALAMVALISAGCSNSVAPTGTGRGGGANNATDRDQAVKFAECMRANGVREFPDPDASGAAPRRDAEVSRSRGRCRRLGGPMKRKTWVLGGGAVLVAVAAIGGGAVVFGAKQAAPAADEPPANTAKVQRGNLSAMVSVDGTLTYQARSDGSPAVVAAGCS